MPISSLSNPVLKPALDRFPGDRPLLLRLFVADEAFRAVCEDYALALDRLAAFRVAPQFGDAAALKDYETLVSELEAELSALVTRARTTGAA